MTTLFEMERERTAERSMVQKEEDLGSQRSTQSDLIDLVDPFIGTEPVDLPARTGVAATWFWPKPQIGNTHPGACLPFGMVSVMPYSGGYPTGYGCYGKSLQGYPSRFKKELQVSGFTHFQQTGVGAIRKYYNYCRVTPLYGRVWWAFIRWQAFFNHEREGYAWFLCVRHSALWYSCRDYGDTARSNPSLHVSRIKLLRPGDRLFSRWHRH